MIGRDRPFGYEPFNEIHGVVPQQADIGQFPPDHPFLHDAEIAQGPFYADVVDMRIGHGRIDDEPALTAPDFDFHGPAVFEKPVPLNLVLVLAYAEFHVPGRVRRPTWFGGKGSFVP